MKNLLISLLFLLAIPTSLQASKNYSKTIFKKQIGKYSYNYIKISKSYDSFFDKTSCSFYLSEDGLNMDINYRTNYELTLKGNTHSSYGNDSITEYAFKFDNNPPKRLTSKYRPEEKVIPFSEWSSIKN